MGATILPFSRAVQPELPEHPPILDPADGVVWARWPEQTVRWWAMWAESPLSATFTATDWSELLDTAVLHARYWLGDAKVAGELRLRVAKFGATPEDRARLRIQFAQADEAESKGERPRPSSRERRGALHALPDPKPSKAAGE